MKANELKLKYPDLWNSVYQSVLNDLIDYLDPDYNTVAHNAAFYACNELHKTLKNLK